jgi:hypothetical protein
MKTIDRLLVCALFLTLCSCAAAKAFHYDVFVFNALRFGKPAETGDGDSGACKPLFDPPGIYIGPYMSIPTNAVVFGVVAVTDGRACAVVPLFEWTDEKGNLKFTCNGASPQFAREGKTRDELIATVVSVIKRK